ncbi:MAG: rhomboid family intramembrane serine protease [Verrucomicrobia bacterium]|nr:rhomboid family intramembrane serine protease [Verrucomicrobiota bacterium]
MNHIRVTYLLIGANIVIFLAMVASGVSFFFPGAEEILKWGGCTSKALLHGEPWRLISSMFLHFGIIHLVMNMYVLYDCGSRLEPLIGKIRFLAIYLASGVFGSLTSQLVHLHAQNTVEAGASGAVFGIVGALFAFHITLLPEETHFESFKKFFTFVGINLLYGMKSANVGVAAHIGGAVSGILLGFAFYPSMTIKEKPYIKPLTVFLVTFLTFFASMKTLDIMKSSDVFPFNALVEEIDLIREDIVKLQEQIASQPPEFFESKILPQWDKIDSLAQKTKDFRLYGKKAEHRDYVVQWVTLHRRKYHLCARAIREGTAAYDQKILAINKEIEELTNRYQ